MAHVYEGVTWFVKGVDSVSTHDEHGKKRDVPLWCRHDESGGDFEENRTHIICTGCGRQFAKVHPVTAEQVIRDRDAEIIRLEAMMNYV